MWNNRVMVSEHTYPCGTKEFAATVHEVHYTNDDNSTGYTEEIAPMGVGESTEQALVGLKAELELMLEAVEFAIQGKTSIFDYEKPETHNPGEQSLVMRMRNAKDEVLDKDDAYMAEKYDEED